MKSFDAEKEHAQAVAKLKSQLMLGLQMNGLELDALLPADLSWWEELKNQYVLLRKDSPATALTLTRLYVGLTRYNRQQDQAGREGEKQACVAELELAWKGLESWSMA